MFNEDVWPSSFDDGAIDDIIWSEIKDSPSRGDFICYLIHRPQHGKHFDEAQQRLQASEGIDKTPVGYGRAVTRIQALAEGGDANALFHMGKLAVHGIGVPQDMLAAEIWYLRAIAAGEMRAACNLGWIYLYGFGSIPPNKEEALRLLTLGAESGVPSAKASVGLAWLTGDGCAADPAKGVRLLEESFALGYANAANQLADAYFAGQYLAQDKERAHEWLAKAAATGDERTMAILGHYLVTGSHGKTDVARGLEWLEQSVAKGYVPAYLWIGNLYRHGQGVAPDLDKARAWLEKGAAAGNTGCDKVLSEMMEQMTPPTAPRSSTLQ